MSLYNSNNGQHRLRFNFGKKFTPKPLNPELSEQENMMNMINDYRQWQQDNPQPDCSNMSTREILEAVVSDFRAQQREEEEAKKAAQMQTPYAPIQNAPTYVAQRAYVPAGQATYGETETIGGAQQQPAQTQESTWRKVGGNADYMSAAARQGLSYGWSDELEGGIGGISYAVSSLVPGWNKNNESMVEAFKRGYITHRDEERQKLEEGRKNAPVLTTISEAAGAIPSPIGASKLPKAPYLNTVKKIPLKKAAAYGTFYGTGTAENGNAVGETLGNYAENMGLGAVGSLAGYGLNKQLFGYAGGVPLVRKTLETTIDTATNKLYNKFKGS